MHSTAQLAEALAASESAIPERNCSRSYVDCSTSFLGKPMAEQLEEPEVQALDTIEDTTSPT